MPAGRSLADVLPRHCREVEVCQEHGSLVRFGCRTAPSAGRAPLVRGTWNRAHGIQGQESVENVMARSPRKKMFVVCLSNDGYAASLETRKIYVALPDAEAKRNGLLRVVDESGEDYLYSRERFAPLKLPRGLEQALASVD